MRRRDDRGETLVETIMTIVVIGGAIAALLLALSNAAFSAASDRKLVTADAVMRSYAEATKSAVRTSCPEGSTGSTYKVPYTPPTGFAVSSSSNKCPEPVTTIRLTVTGISIAPEYMRIAVRTP